MKRYHSAKPPTLVLIQGIFDNRIWIRIHSESKDLDSVIKCILLMDLNPDSDSVNPA